MRFWTLIFAIFIVATPVRAGKLDTRSPGALLDQCLGKFHRVALKAWHRLEKIRYGLDGADQRLTARLAAYPRRRLEADFKTSEFLKTHPVFISVTTSPKRISHLPKVLRSLDTTHVTEILVVLPKVFGRDGRPYDIPKELIDFPKVRIVEIPVDLGPATKLVPAAQLLSQRSDQPVVITVDDDIVYPAGMVNELIAASAEFPNAAIGGAGSPLSYWRISGLPSEAGSTPFWTGDISLRPVDVIEGYAAVAYPAKKVPVQTITDWHALSEDCRNSDDLVISMALRANRVMRYEIHSQFYSRDYLYILDHGLESDALHKNASFGEDNGRRPYFGDIIQTKYRRAFSVLMDKVKIK